MCSGVKVTGEIQPQASCSAGKLKRAAIT